MDFELILIDIDEEVCAEFEEQFGYFPHVRVVNGFFEEVDTYDCMVSPANSFGMMDGGIDKSIIDYFGKELEDDVQHYILEHYSGEQPVGTSFILPTFHPKHPFLAHTPTMQIPQNIEGTTNVYYAMKAMLSAVKLFNKTHEEQIKSVLCPGMGTLIGEMSPYEAVRQMALAYGHFITPPREIHVPFIYERLAQIQKTLD